MPATSPADEPPRLGSPEQAEAGCATTHHHRTEADVEWIATPDQRRQRYIDALRSLRRPCECAERCPVQERWWTAIDGVLDAWLESDRLMGARDG